MGENTGTRRLVTHTRPNSLTNHLRRIERGLPVHSADRVPQRVAGKSRRFEDYLFFITVSSATPTIPLVEKLVSDKLSKGYSSAYPITAQRYTDSNPEEVANLRGYRHRVAEAAGIILVDQFASTGETITRSAIALEQAYNIDRGDILTIRGDWWQQTLPQDALYLKSNGVTIPNTNYSGEQLVNLWANITAQSISELL